MPPKVRRLKQLEEQNTRLRREGWPINNKCVWHLFYNL